MKPYEINLNDYSVALAEDGAQKDCIVSMPGQSLIVEAADEVPLFLGVKGKLLAGKAYAIPESIDELPLKDCKEIIEKHQLDPKSVQVYLGPCLTFAHTEEKEEVLARVNKNGYGLACKGSMGKHYLDHQLLVALQMRKLGIPMANIHQSEYDTLDSKGLKSQKGGDKEKNRFLATLH